MTTRSTGKNVTALYKKLDRISEKMQSTDDIKELTKQLARSTDVVRKISAEQRKEGQRSLRDITHIANDVAAMRRKAVISAKRTAAILAGSKRH